MAVKARNRKRLESEDRMRRAMKIKCCYCDAKETCVFRKNKEASENKGITTYCTLTPNALKRKKKPVGPKNFFEAMFSGEDQKKEYSKRKKQHNKSGGFKNKRKAAE